MKAAIVQLLTMALFAGAMCLAAVLVHELGRIMHEVVTRRSRESPSTGSAGVVAQPYPAAPGLSDAHLRGLEALGNVDVVDAARRNGRSFADLLRRLSPEDDDVAIARHLMILLDWCVLVEDAAPDLSQAWVMLTDAIGMAALDLTAWERADR